MSSRDVALTAFRLLAVWVCLSALMALLDTLLTWDSIVAKPWPRWLVSATRQHAAGSSG